MKIAVNIHCLHPPLTGIGHYARHILQILIDHPEVEELRGISQQGWHSEAELREILNSQQGYQPPTQTGSRPAQWLLKLKKLARKVPGIYSLYHYFFSRPPIEIAPQQTDCIYWEPNYLPLRDMAGRAVITVHDLSHLRCPQFHPGQRLLELDRLPAEVAAAGQVITVSEFTRAELEHYFKLENNKVSVVTPAVNKDFVPQSGSRVKQLRDTYSLPESYLLFVGTIEPRKNLEGLLLAYNSLDSVTQRQQPLVIVGARGWHIEEFDELMAELNNANMVLPGYIESRDLPALYSGATMLIYPSLYEGFGMPVLEAMACGTAVITSDITSMPEVAASAAQLIDPTDIDAIAATITRVLADSELRQSMVEKGLAVASRYSWEKSANDLLAAFKKADL